MVEAILKVCPGFQSKRETYDGALRRLLETADEPYREVYLLFPSDGLDTSIRLIDLVPNEHTSNEDAEPPKAILIVAIDELPGIGERIVRFFTRQHNAP